MAAPNTPFSNYIPGRFYTLEKVHPAGTLQARRYATGVTTFFWRCTIDKRDFREPIGIFDPKCPPLALAPTTLGFSKRAAAIEAGKLGESHDLACFGPVAWSAVDVRRFHLATVFWLIP